MGVSARVLPNRAVLISPATICGMSTSICEVSARAAMKMEIIKSIASRLLRAQERADWMSMLMTQVWQVEL